MSDKVRIEHELISKLGVQGICIPCTALVNDKYLIYKTSRVKKVKYEKECILEHGLYYTYTGRDVSVSGLSTDPKENSENLNKFFRNEFFDKEYFIEFENFDYDCVDKNIFPNNYIHREDTFEGGVFITDINSKSAEWDNAWLNKHRLKRYIENPNFYIRELTEKDLEQVKYLYDGFLKSKKAIKEWVSFKGLYNRFSIDLQIFDVCYGFFYKDILLGYRAGDVYGNTIYFYIENCVSNCEIGKLVYEYIKEINSERLHSVVKKSSDIAKQIILAKEVRKWKQAKRLAENKDFKGTLENPTGVDTIAEYRNLIKENSKSDISFLKTRVKLLMLYKFIEYLKDKGYKNFSVDAGAGDTLSLYKQNTNSYNLKCFVAEPKKENEYAK